MESQLLLIKGDLPRIECRMLTSEIALEIVRTWLEPSF